MDLVAGLPNVKQVVNELEVKNQKGSFTNSSNQNNQ
jgi:hypothetical protein